MDIQIGETPAGRMKFELFSDIVPKFVEPAKSPCGRDAHSRRQDC